MKSKNKNVDYQLLFNVLLLLIVGVLFVFSSSNYYSIINFGDKFYFLKKELVWATLGLFSMFIFSNINYRILRKVALPLAALAIIPLALTPFFGITVNGAKRWFEIAGIRFMPSEVVKFTSIILFSYWFTSKKTKIKTFKNLISPYIFYIGLVLFLIYKQPNYSTMMLIASVLFTMLIAYKVKFYYFIPFFAIGGVGSVYLALTEEYRFKRILTFMDPFQDQKGDGWQVVNSLLALGSGGVWGAGIGKSIQNKLYIPEPQNDFILATIGEETGLIGTLGLLLLFYWFYRSGLRISRNAPDKFGKYLALGFTILITYQAILNIGVATASLPPTGIPLPFISYGGTNLVILLTGVGIMLNISKEGVKN